jgi:hypothetical protein
MDVLRVVLWALELDLQDGEVGTHSIWKCASTHVRGNGNGVSKDDKDTRRGRWKATACVSDRYDSVQLPYVTGHQSCGFSLHWQRMHIHVEPGHPGNFGLPPCCSGDLRTILPQVALVLGNALLFTFLNDSVSHLVLLFIKDRVLPAYAVAGLEEETSPYNGDSSLSLETMRMCLPPKCHEKKWQQGRMEEAVLAHLGISLSH